jgi:putative ABC transport system permease protein
VLIIAGMVATVLLTTGRTVGAEQAVLSSIDSAGTRSIVVRAEADAGLDTSVLDRIKSVQGIAWVGAFGPAQDVTNAAIPDGVKVPARYVWGAIQDLGIPAAQPIQNHSAWASPAALQALGMPDAAGGVVTNYGADFAVTGTVRVPDYLAFFEPIIFIPQQPDTVNPSPVSVLVVIASRPDLVATLSTALQPLLGVDDPTKVKITTSEDLATLRAIVQGQLGTFGRSLVIVIFALTAILVAAILYGLVMLRRKDFGRRRALGASQGLIVGLLLIQMAALSLLGALFGSIAAAIGLIATSDPLPGADFFIATVVLATGVGVTAALIPAIAASRRDPLIELRVP